MMTWWWKKISLILCVLLFCCAMKPVSKAHSKSNEKKVQEEVDNALWCHIEALKALRIKQDTIAAIRYAERCLLADSMYAPANFILSSVLGEDSVSFLQAYEAYRKDTTNVHYLDNLAQKCISVKRYDKAVDFYRKLASRHSNPDDFRILSLLLIGNDRANEAIMVLDSAELFFGKYPIFNQIREDIYMQKGKFKEAEKLALETISDFPYQAENYTILASIYERSGKDSLALVNYQKAVKVDSVSVAAWSGLYGYAQRKNDIPSIIDCHLHLFTFPEVPLQNKISTLKTLTSSKKLYTDFYPLIDSLHKILYTKHKTDEEVIKMYSQHLIVSSKTKEAEAVWQTFMSSQTKPSTDNFCFVIELELFLKQYNRALGYIQSAKRSYPENLQFPKYEVHAFMQLKQNDKAESILTQLIKKTTDKKQLSILYGLLGDIYSSQKKLSNALNMFKKAVALDDDNITVLNNYAYLLSENNRELDHALSMSTKVVAKDGSNATFLDTLAWILYKLQRLDEAKKYMQQAISIGGTDMAVLYMHYGDILFAQGNAFVAKIYWKKALENGYTPAEDIEKRINASETK